MLTHIFVGSKYTDSVSAINVQTPASPTLSSSGQAIGAYKVAVANQFAYTIEFDGVAFTILDASNPSNVSFLSKTNLQHGEINYLTDVLYYTGNWVIATGTSYLIGPPADPDVNVWAIDVSDKNNPVATRNAIQSGYSYRTAGWIKNQYLYVAIAGGHHGGTEWDQIRKCNLTNVPTVTVSSSLTSTTYASRYTEITGSGNYIFVSWYNSNVVRAYDISSGITFVNSIAVTAPRGLVVKGTKLLVCSETTNSIVTIDISDPTNMSVASTFTDNTNLAGCGFLHLNPENNNVAYVSCPSSNRITVLNVTDPTNISVYGTLTDAILEDVYGIGSESYTQHTSSFTIDTNIVSKPTSTFTVDTIIQTTPTKTFTVDTVILQEIPSVHTIGTGGTRNYTSFTAWEAAQQRNLTTNGEIEIAECYNDGILTDSFTISGWTTSSACYIKIYTPVEQRHTGYLGTGFQLRNTASAHTITIENPNVIIQGLEFDITTTGKSLIYVSIASGSGFLKFSHNVMATTINNANCITIGIAPATVTVSIWNNFLYAVWGTIPNVGSGIYVADTDVPCYIYGNSIAGFAWGITVAATNAVRAWNNASLGCTRDFNQTSYFANSDYNASTADAASTYRAPGANSQHSVSLGSYLSIAYGWENLHLRNSTNPLYGNGTDLSADIYLAFTDDIDGETRTRWDIGADFFVYVAPTTITHTVGTSGTRDYTSLTAWEAAQQRSLCNEKEIEIAECYNDGIITGGCTLSGWATSEDYYIKIYAPISERHHGYAGSGVRLAAVSGNQTIDLRHANIWIEGLEIPGYQSAIFLYITTYREFGWIKISKNIFTADSNAGGISPYNYATLSPCYIYIWNNIFYALPSGMYGMSAVIYGTWYIYSNTFYGFYGIYITAAGGNITAKNNAVLYTSAIGNNYNQKSYFSNESCNNASSLSAASAYGAPGSNSIYDALSGDNYYSATVLRIKSTSVLRNVGVDLSADPYLAFSDDILGLERGASWDIGAFEYSAPTTHTSTVGTAGAPTRDYSSLTAWEAQNLNLLGENQIEIAECYNDGVMTDNVVIAGWTTINECYIKIYTPQAQRHTGLKGTGFRLTGASGSDTITINVVNVWVEGLSISNASTTKLATYVNVASGSSGWSKFAYNLVYNCYGNYWADLPSGSIAYIWNNFIIACGYGIYISETLLTAYVYSNSVYACTVRGIIVPATGALVRAKDNVSLGNTSNYDFYQVTYFHADSNYNCSTADAANAYRAPGANSLYSKLATNNYQSLVVGSENLHIKSGAADIYRSGTNLSADASLAFTDDIGGDVRPQSPDAWSMGGDEVPPKTFLFTVDTLITDQHTSSFTIDVVILNLFPFTIDALIAIKKNKTFTIDTIVSVATKTSTFTADALLQKTQTATFTLDTYIVSLAQVTVDAILQKTTTATFTIDAIVLETKTVTATLDAYIVSLAQVTLDAILQETKTTTFTTDAIVLETKTATATLDAYIVSLAQVTVDAILQETKTTTFTIDAHIVTLSNFTIDAHLVSLSTFTVDAIVLETKTETFTLDTHIVTLLTFTIDAIIRADTDAAIVIAEFVPTKYMRGRLMRRE